MAMVVTRNSSRRSPLVVVLIAVVGQLACLGDVEVPPLPPTLLPITSPVFLPFADVGGSKPPGTAVLNLDVEVVPLEPHQRPAPVSPHQRPRRGRKLPPRPPGRLN